MPKPPHNSFPPHRRQTPTRPISISCLLAVALSVSPARLYGNEATAKHFNVPAGEAAATLRQFSDQAGVQLLVSSNDLQGVSTQAIQGDLAPLAALQQMLAHTRLTARQERTTGAIAVVAAPSPKKKSESSPPPSKTKGSSGMKANRLTSLLVGIVAATFSSITQAQVPPEKDEVLTLDAFTVTSKKTSGYRATNSITATGMGAEIGETPIVISVVTKDLITDTRSDLINDTLRFVPGAVTAPTNESQPFVRGFQGTYSLRNGVFRRQNLTTWNVDRVEVIQGSSSIFYSNIRPGGVINYITTKPVLGENFVDATLTGGNYNYYRAEAAFNVAAGDKLAFRIDLGSSGTNSFRRQFEETQSFVSFAAVWNITPNHQITFETAAEQTWRQNSWSEYATPLTNSRYWNNPAAIASGQTLAAFMAANYPGLPRYDMFAPFAPRADDPYGRRTPILSNAYQHGTDRPIDLTYLGKLTDRLVFSIIANYAWEDNEGINPVWSGDIFADGTFRSFGAQRFVNVRDSFNLNTKLTYRLDVAKTKHTLMVGNDNQWVTQRFPQVNGGTNQNSPTFTYNPQAMGAMDGRFLVASSTAPFNSTRKTLQYFEGNYIVDQLSLLNDTLFIVAGERHVNFKQHVTYRGDTGAVLPTPPPDAIAKKWTPQFGALYKVGAGLSVFGTYSSSVIPQTQIDASGKTVLPIDGKGWDAGLKIDALNGAFTGTIDYYEIKQTNTALSDNVQNAAHGLPNNATFGYYTYGNAQQVRGLQFDLTYTLARNFQLIAGFNHFFQAENVAPQSTANMIGVPIAYQPENMVTVWARYQASSGPAKGLILGGGFHANSKGTVGGTFDQSQLFVPAFTVVDAFVGYDAKLLNRNVELRLNAKNLFNKIYRDGVGGAFNAPFTVYLSASTRF